jgi:hypothetical protein
MCGGGVGVGWGGCVGHGREMLKAHRRVELVTQGLID